MAKPDIDWTFEDAPADGEPVVEAADSRARGAPLAPGRRPPRQPWPRWLRREYALRWLALLTVVGVSIALGAWAVARLGLQRVREQVTAEVLYEDEHSRAGEADLALSVWADPPGPLADPTEPITAWRLRRLIEISAHLGAPLPADQLLPTDAAPVVTTVEALPNDATIWIATVVRTYTDPAGHALTFALPQRYHNLGPGLWERVPPVAADLADTTVVSGLRFLATVPVADLPWLSESLVAADAALVQACADWGPGACGEAKLVVTFSGLPQQLFPAGAVPPGPAAGFGPYPAAFDLAPALKDRPVPLVLPSPHVAGLPQTAAGRAALTHALTVYGLTVLVNAQAGSTHRRVDYFGEALVARAEMRLGLSEPPTYTLRAENYLPLTGLWDAGLNAPLIAPAAALPPRLLVLNFLDATLAGQPATTDAALLRVLRRRPGLTEWLDSVLGEGTGRRALAEWEAQAAAAFEVAGQLRWADLEGLNYSCDEGSYLVRGGQAQLLPVTLPWAMAEHAAQAPSPDGRYLASVESLPSGQIVLQLYDLSAPAAKPTLVASADAIYLLGWSAAQGLVYIAPADGDPSLPTAGAAWHLQRFDLATNRSRQLSDNIDIPWLINPTDWLPDRRSIVVVEALPGEQVTAPMLVPVDDDSEAEPQRLAVEGLPGVLAPDGQWLAYAVPHHGAGETMTLDTVEAVALATGERRVLLRMADLHALDFATNDLITVQPIGWAGGSGWVAVLTSGANAESRLMLLPLDGSSAPLQLAVLSTLTGYLSQVEQSADGRYLTYHTTGPGFVNVLDRDPVPAFAPAAMTAQLPAFEMVAAAWSPAGHLLALVGPAGLRVVDLDTGLARWVHFGACSAVAWYPPAS